MRKSLRPAQDGRSSNRRHSACRRDRPRNPLTCKWLSIRSRVPNDKNSLRSFLLSRSAKSACTLPLSALQLSQSRQTRVFEELQSCLCWSTLVFHEFKIKSTGQIKSLVLQ